MKIKTALVTAALILTSVTAYSQCPRYAPTYVGGCGYGGGGGYYGGGEYYGGGYGNPGYGNKWGAYGNGNGATLNGVAGIIAAVVPVLTGAMQYGVQSQAIQYARPQQPQVIYVDR